MSEHEANEEIEDSRSKLSDGKLYKVVYYLWKKFIEGDSNFGLDVEFEPVDMILGLMWVGMLSYVVFAIYREFSTPLDVTLLFDRNERRRLRYASWEKWPWSWIWPFRNEFLDPPPPPRAFGARRKLLKTAEEVLGVETAGFFAYNKNILCAIGKSVFEDFCDECATFCVYSKRVFGFEEEQGMVVELLEDEDIFRDKNAEELNDEREADKAEKCGECKMHNN